MSELADARKALKITDVYFRDETIRVAESVTPPMWPDCGRTQFKMVTRVLKELEIEPEGPPEEEGAVRLLEVEFVGSVRCLSQTEGPADADPEALLSIEVKLGLLYQVTAQCSKDSIEDFIKLNVPYHAIPYWREYVHSACARRRFAPITVPMYTQALQRGGVPQQQSNE